MAKVKVSWHAVERYLDRFDSGLSDRQARGVIAKAFRQAVPFGGQRGRDLLMIHEDLVMVYDAKCRVIKTILTTDQAMANMQAAKIL